MLVLSRKRNEKIILECSEGIIEILVTAIPGDRVRLGISAPRSVGIHREEVFRAIERQRAGVGG